MLRFRSSWLITSLAGALLLLTACASAPPAPLRGPPPDVLLGPVLDVLPLKTSGDHVAALLDAQGNAHVLVAAADTRDVHHVVVSPDGMVQRERVESGAAPSAISAAFDHEGRLHLLLDDRQLVREASGWKPGHDTPWEMAGLKVRRPRIVQGPKGLLWSFVVDGEAVGARGRWDWYGFGGGFGAGIIFPWHGASKKLVMVPEAAVAPPLWYVLDPQDNLDVANAMPAVDNDAHLHVVYDASREGMAASYLPRYAEVAMVLDASQANVANTRGKEHLYSFSGNEIPFIDASQTGFVQTASAVDPATGTVLIVRANDTSFARRRGKWRMPLQLPLSRYWAPRLAPAGGGAFHLITTADKRVLYLLYAQGGWSNPVELGQASVASGIAGSGHDRAFVVWPTETGIVGRWVDASREIQARDSAPQDDALPDILLRFAHGEAELITPGWTTGFAAATAAGAHGRLARHLHDSGQWETLAQVVLKDKYGDNLGWYYLGRAAEGMGLCDAALHYYRISRERSERFETRCLSIACHGIELPDALGERVTAVGALRAAGKCIAPPPAP